MNGPVEPSADHRIAAAQLRQWYLALLAEGFTERESLVIVGQTIAGVSNQGDS